jgi:hypothetical protein
LIVEIGVSEFLPLKATSRNCLSTVEAPAKELVSLIELALLPLIGTLFLFTISRTE